MIRQRNTKAIRGGAAFAALSATTVFALVVPGAPALAAGELSAVGDQIAGHALTRLDGVSVAVQEMRGEVVVVNFWATWCKPCQDELPVLDALNRRLSERGGRVLAVSIDRDRDKVERFVAERELGLPVFHDGPSGLVEQLDLDYFPFTVVFDRAGRAVYSTHETSKDALVALEAKAMELASTSPVKVAEGAHR